MSDVSQKREPRSIKDGNVVVQITKSGRNGYQVIQTIIDQNGNKRVVQLAYDASGQLVRVDPKK